MKKLRKQITKNSKNNKIAFNLVVIKIKINAW